MKHLLLGFVLCSLAFPAVAAWTVSSQGAPSGCTHLISDGNWQIGINQVSGGWLLGKSSGKTYVVGSGTLDLRNAESECGVRIVETGNGAIEGVTTLTEILLPDSVINLNGASFKNCTALTNVVLGAGVKAIGSANKETFLGCTSLKTINFPDGLEKIGDNAFQNCTSLELVDVVLPSSVTTLGDHVFANCTKLSGSFSGSGVKTFAGNYHFEKTTLTNISFTSATKIPDGICNEIKTLVSADFGSDIESIGFRAFRSCSALATISYDGPIASISYEAFSGCSAYVLGEHTFPMELKTLGDHAFAGCAKLAGPLVFPGLETISGTYTFEDSGIVGFTATNCTTIVQGMFNKCKKIESAVFSPNVTSFGSDVFRNGNSSLLSMYPTEFPLLSGTFGTEAFHGQKNVAIPVFDLSKSTITAVGNYAFADCHNVGTIKLPETLTTLGDGCLGYNDGKLRAVWFYGPPPTTIGGKALMPKERDTSKYWVLIAGRKHADEWKTKVGTNITANDVLDALGDGEEAAAKAAAQTLGLSGVRPIGKWKHTASGFTYWNWVVEELPKGLVMVVK